MIHTARRYKVIARICNYPCNQFVFKYGDIKTTAEHPFFVLNKGWTAAKLIQMGTGS
jgi:hypothetical protein